MIVLISLDGLGYKNFERWSQSFTDKGFSYCKQMMTTFPSVTFNAHATAMTGNSHDRHSVYDNIVADVATMNRIALYGDHEALCNEELHKQTIFHSLSAQGLKSCCIHWPLTTGNPYIQKLITESSSKKKAAESISYEELDQTAAQETIEAVMSGAFDFIAARFVGYDACSHEYGKDSREAILCAEKLLQHIHRIHHAFNELQQPFHLLIFSDHGQSEVKSFFYPNEILAQSRWSEHLLNRQIRFVGDGSGALLFYSKLTKQENQEIMDHFNQMEAVQYFHEIEEPAASACQVFRPVGILDLKHTVCGEDTIPPDQPQYKTLRSLHGYDPANVEEMNGFMVCIGDQLKTGLVFEHSHLVHIAPTIAKLLHIPHQCDGGAITDILKEHE